MTVRQTISVTEALESKKLFGTPELFANESWNRWRAVLKAAFAEPLTAAELALFKEVAARDPPTRRVKELVAIVGRGGGKDSTASIIAAYIAASFDPRAAKLRPGELAYVLCLAVDRDQAAIVFRYIAALFEQIPTLRAMVKGDIGHDSITLKNRVVIEVKTNSYRTIRGRSVLATIFDEVAFWRDAENSQNPDVEVHGAVTPGLERVVGSMLIMISSAHRRLGLLYERHQDCYGKNDNDTLVVKGGTRLFNPTYSQATIDRAIRRDPARFGAEYNSEWRDDLTNFLTREMIDAAVAPGVTVRPPIEGVIYCAACDSSSGKGDSFTMCISHKEMHHSSTGGSIRIVIDFLYEKRPPPKFNPNAAIAEIATILKQYRCATITGDNYAVGFVIDGFRRNGIEYRVSRLNRSEAYLGFLPLMLAGQVLLIDHHRSITQFAGLVRRPTPSGRDSVDHEKGGHDDCSNAVALAACLASVEEQIIPMGPPIVAGQPDPYTSGPRPTAEQRQAAATFDQLSQQRDLLNSRRNALEQERKRCADDAASGMPDACVQLKKLTEEMIVIGIEQQRVDTAMAKAERPPATNGTVPYYDWVDHGGGGGPPGGWTSMERF
jgi:hypothetical protein